MTRINLVPVKSLTDQHLLAEYRELPRVFPAARLCSDAPAHFVLGAGHVKFFYDKLKFLEKRLQRIIAECLRRGIKIKNTSVSFSVDPALYNDYVPRVMDIELSRRRIEDRISLKPDWYKFYGKSLTRRTNS